MPGRPAHATDERDQIDTRSLLSLNPVFARPRYSSSRTRLPLRVAFQGATPQLPQSNSRRLRLLRRHHEKVCAFPCASRERGGSSRGSHFWRPHVFKNTETFSTEYSNFTIVDLQYRLVESLVKITRGDEYWESFPDTERQIVERQEILQVTVEADFNGALDEGDQRVSLRYNLPLETLPQEVVDRLKTISGTDWFWDDNSSERRDLALTWVQLSVEKITQTIRTIDYERSELCACGEDCWDCEHSIVGKDVLREFQRLTVTARQRLT